MSVLRSRPVLRWLVPATAAVAVIGGGAAIGTFAAEAEPSLPPRTAAQLLVDLQTSRLEGLSGTVVQRADLGLPPLVGLVPGNELTTLLTGTHTLRVWYSGPDQQRVALLDTLGEQDVIRNGRDVWTWQSRSNTATHRTLGGDAGAGKPAPEPAAACRPPRSRPPTWRWARSTRAPRSASAGRPPSPAGTPTSWCSSRATRTPWCTRCGSPSTPSSTCRCASRCSPKGSDRPAFEMAFTQVDYRRPDADQFTLQPAARRDGHRGEGRAAGRRPGPASPATSSRRVTRRSVRSATGWTTVLVGRLDGAEVGASRREAGDATGRLAGRGHVEAARRTAGGQW